MKKNYNLGAWCPSCMNFYGMGTNNVQTHLLSAQSDRRFYHALKHQGSNTAKTLKLNRLHECEGLSECDIPTLGFVLSYESRKHLLRNLKFVLNAVNGSDFHNSLN